MTKLEFMKELESLLSDIPLEEREEALQYYNGYFEDAGEDHEDEIVKELGSPKRVAAIIKADLNSNAAERESRGYFTENGYQDNIYNEEKFELVGAAKNGAGNTDQTNNANASNGANNTNNNSWKQGQSYSQGANQGTSQGMNQNSQQANKKKPNTGLIVLVCILASPFILGVGLPVILSFFGVAIGLLAALIGIIIALGAAGIAMICAGIALFIAGLIQLSAPLVGLLLCGTGLVTLGLGMLFTLLCGVICKTLIPAIIKGIVNLCRLPFKNRSVMA